MNPHVSAITIGVKDINRAKEFYSEGLGWPIAEDHGTFVSFTTNKGSSRLGLYTWDALADDAGVAAEGSGFRGVTFSYIVRADARVDAVLTEAESAGGTIAKPAENQQWGGRSGYFTDPDGYLWKVAAGTGEQPFAE
jgi:uncharacterized protein